MFSIRRNCTMGQISKTEFKTHALKVFREIEKTGVSQVITDHGKPVLEIKKLRQRKAAPLNLLKNSVISFVGATDPVSEDDWENA